MNKNLNIINLNLLLSLIFFNYLLYFIFETRTFFPYFAIVILLVFFYLIYENFKLTPEIFYIIFILSFISLGSPVADWDARSIWLFNSKRIFFNENLNQFTNYFGSEFSHLDYPILIQTLSASLASLIGNWNEIFPKYSSIIMILPALVIVSKILKNKVDKLIFIILIFFIYEKRLINGEMDALLGLYTISTIILLMSFSKLKNLNLENLIKLFLFIMTLTMIKIEGLGILICIFLSYMIVYFKYNKKLNNKIILVFVLSVVPIILWKLFIYDKNIVSSSNLMISNGERLLENLLNFKFILLLIKSILLNKQMFLSLAIVFIILSKYIYIDKGLNKIIINKKLFNRELSFIFFTILSYSLLLLLIFILSEGSPNNVFEMKYFMTISSSDRLFLPVHSLILLYSIYLNKNFGK